MWHKDQYGNYVNIFTESVGWSKMYDDVYEEHVSLWTNDGLSYSAAGMLVRRGIDRKAKLSDMSCSLSQYNSLSKRAKGEFQNWMERTGMVFYGKTDSPMSQFLMTKLKKEETEEYRSKTGNTLFWDQLDKNHWVATDRPTSQGYREGIWAIKYEEKHTYPFVVQIGAEGSNALMPRPMGLEARTKSLESAKKYAEDWHGLLCRLYRNNEPLEYPEECLEA